MYNNKPPAPVKSDSEIRSDTHYYATRNKSYLVLLLIILGVIVILTLIFGRDPETTSQVQELHSTLNIIRESIL